MGAVQNYVSVSRRPPDIEDYIDMARRHRSWIIGPTFAGLVIAVVVAFLWPDTYESVAQLQITPQVVSEQMVPDTITTRINQRLEGMRTEIMSRGYLTSLINDPKLKLYPKLVQKYTLEDAIAQMQKDVKIMILDPGGSDRRYATSFQIKFSYPDRRKAMEVVQDLVTQFVNRNASYQSSTAKQTQDFLASQLKDAQANLDRIQGSIAKFRSENLGRLPEQATLNVTELNSLTAELSAANDRLARQQEARNMQVTYLQSRTEMLNLLMDDASESGSALAVKNQNLINLDKSIRDQEMQLVALKQLYQDAWPDVKKAEAQLQSLKQEKAQEEARAADAANKPQTGNKGPSLTQRARIEQAKGEIATIKTSIQNLDTSIQQTNQERANIQNRVQEVKARIDASPLIDQQWAQLTQDLTTATDLYNGLKTKEAAAAAAKDLQDNAMGEQLRLVDPASLPEKPSDPNRWLITGIGTAIGLLMGMVLAGVKEAKDTSLKNLKDVRAYTNLPVLSSIPLLENALLVRRKRRLYLLSWSTAVIVGVMAMLGAWSYYISPHAG